MLAAGLPEGRSSTYTRGCLTSTLRVRAKGPSIAHVFPEGAGGGIPAHWSTGSHRATGLEGRGPPGQPEPLRSPEPRMCLGLRSTRQSPLFPK